MSRPFEISANSFLRVLVLLLTCAASQVTTDAQSIDQLPQTNDQFIDWRKQVESISNLESSALARLDRLIEVAANQQQYHVIPILCTKLEKIAHNTKRWSQAATSLERALELLPADCHEERAQVFNLLGLTFKQVRFLEKSLMAYQSSLEEYGVAKNRKQSVPLGNLAFLFESIGNIEQAIELVHKSNEFTENLDEPENSRMRIKNSYVLGRLHGKLGKHELAEEYFDRSLRMAQKLGDTDLIVHVNNKLLHYLLSIDELGQIKERIPKVESLLDELSSPVGQEEFLCMKTRYFLKLEQPDLAAETFGQIKFMLDSCAEDNEFLQLAADVFVATEQFEKAYYAKLRFSENIQASLKNTRQRQQEGAKALYDFELEKKHADFRNTVLAKQAKASFWIRNLTVSLATLLTITLFTYVFFERKRRLQDQSLVRQRLINRDLNKLVEEKTAALVVELEERAELEKALEKKRRLEAIGQLTGGVAHDFNNLLQVILTANELIGTVASQHLDNSLKELLESSTHSAQTGASIVQQMLAFAGRQVLDPDTINAADFLKRQEKLFDAVAEQKVKLELEPAASAAAIQVDSAKLTTAIINLISNARDALQSSSESVIVFLHWMPADQLHEWPSLHDSGKRYVVLGVTDEGKGMTDEVLHRACEPFFTTNKAESGTGLGLSSVAGFVKQSDGDLLIESKPGRGTTVQLAFPVVQQNSETDASKVTPESRLFRDAAILIVEDNFDVRSVLERQAHAIGMSVSSCESADEAVQLLKAGNQFEFILTDVCMPGTLDGVDLFDWAKKCRPEISVLLMTGFAADQTTAIRKDIPVISKPFTSDEVIRRLLEIQKSAESGFKTPPIA